MATAPLPAAPAYGAAIRSRGAAGGPLGAAAVPPVKPLSPSTPARACSRRPGEGCGAGERRETPPTRPSKAEKAAAFPLLPAALPAPGAGKKDALCRWSGSCGWILRGKKGVFVGVCLHSVTGAGRGGERRGPAGPARRRRGTGSGRGGFCLRRGSERREEVFGVFLRVFGVAV